MKQIFEKIINCQEHNPFHFLGPHIINGKLHIRAYLPLAIKAWIDRLDKKSSPIELNKIHHKNFFEIIFHDLNSIITYKILFQDKSGFIHEFYDPYAYPPKFSDYDLYLLKEGTNYNSFEILGSQIKTKQKIKGVEFSVWAPNAKSVSVVGNFNHWYSGHHPMLCLGDSGIWTLFIPGLDENEVYKYAICSQIDNQIRTKTDPYAFKTEFRPKTASIVCNLKSYKWNDQEWLENRKKITWRESPISIYEIHLGSWKKCCERKNGFLTYKELSEQLIPYVKEIGFTHIELLPIMEHPFDASWGYQTVNYFSPTSRFGNPQDFMNFIDKCHQNNIGVILDWVPSHFPKDDYGLSDFDGTNLYTYDDWKKKEQKDWGTYLFNYARNEVKNFLLSNALFWIEKYHIDGLRVDAVASMLYLDYSRKEGEWNPNEFGGKENLEAIAFLKEFNKVVHHYYPDILTMAEESTAWPGVSCPVYLGGLGFDFKWNMGWMHDQLVFFSKDPIYRKYLHNLLTFSFLYAFTENFVLPISHDEVVHGKKSVIEKMPGDYWQKFANLKLFYGYMFGHPGKKLIFMGNEFGQWVEWNHNNSLDWHLLKYPMHQQFKNYIKDLLCLYKNHSAFFEIDFSYQGFEWIDFNDADSGIISFLRKSKNEILVFVYNLTPVVRYNYRISIPNQGFYKEILNSDAKEYGGSGQGNFGGVHSEEIQWHYKNHSICLTLPPLSTLIFQFSV